MAHGVTALLDQVDLMGIEDANQLG